jgi:hypothetical protein
MAMLNRQKHINALNRVALVATPFFQQPDWDQNPPTKVQ